MTKYRLALVNQYLAQLAANSNQKSLMDEPQINRFRMRRLNRFNVLTCTVLAAGMSVNSASCFANSDSELRSLLSDGWQSDPGAIEMPKPQASVDMANPAKRALQTTARVESAMGSHTLAPRKLTPIQVPRAKAIPNSRVISSRRSAAYFTLPAQKQPSSAKQESMNIPEVEVLKHRALRRIAHDKGFRLFDRE